MSSIQLTRSEQGEPIVPAKVAGDKEYRSQWIDEWLLGQDITPVIPSKKNEGLACRVVEFDKASYRRRCIIEQMIGWIKECRRVATRLREACEKLPFNDQVVDDRSLSTTDRPMGFRGISVFRQSLAVPDQYLDQRVA
jgi:transposase